MKISGQLLILIAIVFGFWLCVLGSNPPGGISQSGPAIHWLLNNLGGGLVVCLVLFLTGGVFWIVHIAKRTKMMEERKYVSEDSPSLFGYIGKLIKLWDRFFWLSMWK